uniref:Uncharacterized protein n=1 Tax=Amphimedon queenslandica TaxID=400682 RepID=A0A1X7UJ13_AMPQE
MAVWQSFFIKNGILVMNCVIESTLFKNGRDEPYGWFPLRTTDNTGDRNQVYLYNNYRTNDHTLGNTNGNV